MHFFAPTLVFAVSLLSVALAQGQEAKDGPRKGKYFIQSYGAPGNPPLVLGSFELGDGKTYKAYLPGGKLSGEGTYEYDAGTKTVTWKTGPYVKVWEGAFTIEREGKTHQIRLKRSTIASNSTDSK
jgi:hypothetical protein